MGLVIFTAPHACYGQNEAESRAALGRIVGAGKVINVHEHIQGEANVASLLGMMDAAGIRKSVLMGSSWFSLALYERAGFTRYDENNAAILAIQEAHPGRFEAWPTVRPEDPEMMEKVGAMVEAGARGIKLYVGHGYTTQSNRYMFHTMALDDPRLLPLYEFCEARHLPMCIHVNSDKPGFADEFVAVLRAYPDLKVNCPHFMLSSGRLSRLREYLRCFPNLYVDISFGHDEFLEDGIERISGDPRGFRALIEDYPKRFFFGTDIVFTDFDPHEVGWTRARVETYYDMLTRERYETPVAPGRSFRGLALAPDLVENILYKNFERFTALEPEDSQLTGEINWRSMRVRPVNREAGQALPPPGDERGERRRRWSSEREVGP